MNTYHIDAVNAEHAWRTERVKAGMRGIRRSHPGQSVPARRRNRQLLLVNPPTNFIEITPEEVAADLDRGATQRLASYPARQERKEK
jgi:hypothetical protein